MGARTTIASQGQEKGDHFFLLLVFCRDLIHALFHLLHLSKEKHSQVRSSAFGRRFGIRDGSDCSFFWSKSIGFGAFHVLVLLIACCSFLYLFSQNRSCKMENGNGLWKLTIGKWRTAGSLILRLRPMVNAEVDEEEREHLGGIRVSVSGTCESEE
jgi:hypothetical protein